MTEDPGGTFSSIFGNSNMEVTHQQVATKLLTEGLLLTALELHTELLESGRELPCLAEFFSNPANLRPDDSVIPSTPGGASPGKPGLRAGSRSNSQMTLDSIDVMTRYSEDTDRKEEDRVAVLEYELRTARDVITQLRSDMMGLTLSERERQTSESETLGDGEQEEAPIKPHEQKVLNWVVHDYLVRQGYRFSSITFSDECDSQNLDDWEEAGMTTARPPCLLSLYRGGNGERSEVCQMDGVTQTEETMEEERQEETHRTQETLDLRLRLETLEQELVEHRHKEEETSGLLREAQEEMVRCRRELQELELERLLLEEKLRVSEERKVGGEEVAREGQLEREDGDGASLADEPVQSPICQQTKSVDASPYPSSPSSLHHDICGSSPRPLPLPLTLSLLPLVLPLPEEGWECNTCTDSLLASLLPELVPSLVVSTRPALVPLLLHTVSRHKEHSVRDSLVELLFNLVKRPDTSTRLRILSGLLWLLHQPGWTSARIEEEVLPQCWEQVSHKHQERRELVAQTVGVLANYVQPSIRGSLLVSLLTQLVDDKEPSVVTAAVRSLSLLSHLLEDTDKLSQVLATTLSLLQRGPIEVVTEVESSLLPVLAMWLVEEAELESRLLQPLLNSLETSLSSLQEEDEAGCEDLVRQVSRLECMVPYLACSILRQCPAYTGEESDPSIPELSPLLISSLGRTILPNWIQFQSLISLPSFSPWPHLQSCLSLVTRLASIQDTFPLHSSLLQCGSSLLSSLLTVLGPIFGSQHLVPLLQPLTLNSALLPQLVGGLARCGDSVLGEAVLPSLFNRLEALEDGADTDEGLRQSVMALSSNPVVRQDMVTWLLRDGVSCTRAIVRRETASLLGLLLPCETEDDGLTQALLSLVQDPEVSVVVSVLPSLASLLTYPELDWEDREAVSTGLTALLGDTREEVVIQTLALVTDLMSSWPGDGRDQLLLLPLTCTPSIWQYSTTAGNDSTTLSSVSPPRTASQYSALLTALSTIPSLSCSESVISGYVLPGLATLLQLVQGQHNMEEAVLVLMSEVEAARRKGDMEGSTGTHNERRESLKSSSSGEEQGTPGRVKDRVGKLFNKPTGLSPFWKK